MRALLAVPGLEGATDAVRLSAVVLAARTPSVSGRVEIRAGELGRWLGVSASYVASEVLPGLRRSGVAKVTTAKGESGMDRGLVCRVLPLWEARGTVGHPLALHRKEYATWLRLLEALMAPGWLHRDGSVTPAGLLGERTGRGAATDRLALLLLALEATETGRVRQCGGRVDTRRGRAAATVARLLGCTASAGERVLERLEDRGLVRRVRLRTASGMAHRTRLMVPAVGAAHRHGAAARRQEDRTAVRGPVLPDPDVAARGSAAPQPRMDAQVTGAQGVGETDAAEPDVPAALHTGHSPAGTRGGSPPVDRGFSGEGRGGEGRRPERARVRGSGAVDGNAAAAGLAPPVGWVHGQNRKDPGTAATEAGTPAPPVAMRGGEPAPRGTAADRRDRLLRIALEPVADVWSQLSGKQRYLVREATQKALDALTGLVGPEPAPRLLADRLAGRLRETGGAARVRDAVGWMLGRGLVQRPACSDVRCDDGVRLDTGGDCPTCGNVIHVRRTQRARIAAEIDTRTPGLATQERRAALEKRMHHQTALDAEDFMRRRRQAEAERDRRDTVRAQAERERAAAQAAEGLRQAQPCADCGATRAAGLCETCRFRRRTRELVEEAGLLATAGATGAENAETTVAHVREAITRAMADARARFLQLLGDEAQDSPEQLASVLAYNDQRVAEQAVAGYRREAEATRAHAAQPRRYRWHPEGESAPTAAAKADARARAGVPVPRGRWAERLAELAVRPISDDTPEMIT
ncbi:hypothetical protein [Streptomyces melanogenes]|uniref:hypothetical protein n=1 Tax=Streptomyces melanogenes TaxID=67326 RepID=UPI00378BA952